MMNNIDRYIIFSPFGIKTPKREKRKHDDEEGGHSPSSSYSPSSLSSAVVASIATKLVAESEAKGSSTRGGSGRGNSSKSSITIFSFWRHWLLRDHILALAGVTAPSEYGLERLKIPPEEEEEVAGGGATVPEHLE
jgi:hypothetical protein